MVDSELVAAYRLNAANCTEVARHFEDVEHKIALLDMAQAWLRLAEITEKFGEALQNVPAPLIMPSGSGQCVAPAELLEEDPAALMYVSAILAQRLNLANQAVVELKSQIELHHMIRSSIGKAVKKMEDLLSATGVYAPGI